MKTTIKALAAALTLLLGFQLGQAGDARAQTVTWRVGHILPALHWSVDDHIKWAKTVLKDTKGRFKLTVLPSGASGIQQPDMLDAVSENLLQMGQVFGSRVAGQEQILEMLDLPLFVPKDVAFRFKLWDALYDDYAKLFAKKYNIYLLDVMQLAPRKLYTKQVVKSLGDLKGLKVRAIGPADSSFTRGIGMVATTTNWPEVYTSIQQGVLDGVWTTDGGAMAMKFFEVAPNLYDTSNAGPTIFLAINKDALAKLPADLRKYLLDSRDAYRKRRRARQVQTGKFIRGLLEKKGTIVHAVSDKDSAHMVRIAGPIIKKWASRLGADTRPIYDKAKAMIDAYRASK